MKTKFVLLIFVVVILGTGSFVLANHLLKKNQTQVSFSQAYEAYQQKDLAKAYELIAPDSESFLEMPEGCELVISVFAELKKLEELVPIAKACIEKGKAMGMSYEALAMALSAQDKIDEAIDLLKSQTPGAEVASLHATLAQLYVFKQDYEEARAFYLKALAGAENWQALLSRILRNQALCENHEFLKATATLVSQKNPPSQNLEEIFIEKAKEMQMPDVAEMLSKHLDH